MKRIPMPLRLSASGKGFLPAIAGLVCLAALVNFVFWPLWTRLRNVDHQNEVQLKVLEDLTQWVNSADEVASKFPAYAQYVQVGKTQEEQAGAFLKEVETIAKSAAVQIVKQQPYEVKGGADYLDINLQLELEAPLRDILSFLYAIDNSEDLMRIMQMRLIPKASSPAPMFRCQVEISKRHIR